MTPLRTASFNQLFMTAFTVNLAFHLLLALPGFIAAFVNPSLFHWNDRSMDHPAGALGVWMAVLLMLTLLNAAASALGSLVWIALRPLIGRRPAA